MRAEVGVQKFDKDNNKIFELLADSVYTEGDKVHAVGNAIVFNGDLYIIADKVVYDKEQRVLDVQGNVKIYKGGSIFSKTNQAIINMTEDYGIVEPFYVQDSQSGMWIGAAEAQSNNKIYSFKKAMVSGCSIERPVWYMNISSGSFDSEKSTLSVWNPTLYIGDVPIFYFPYLRLSTKNERSSGFLYPQFATSSREGFIFIQPIYIAVQNFWDMTLTPQIRTDRGFGGSLEFRAIDSQSDKFIFNAKYFFNKDSYVERYNLRNKHIFGFDFLHSSDNPLKKYFGMKKDIDNGLYLDFLYMNDLDYLRFEKFNARITDGTRMSKANFYIQTQDHYYGINFRYFLNLNKINNDTTFQSLPNLQYHKYLDSLFFKNLLYSIDYQMKNIYRNLGYSYVENSIKIPLGLQFSLFNQYLSLGIWSDVYASNLGIYNMQKSYIDKDITTRKTGNFLLANYTINLNMDLAKDYNKIFHVVNFEASFTAPYFQISDGVLDRAFLASADYTDLYNKATGQYLIGGKLYDDVWNPATLSDYKITTRKLDLKLNQYFFGSKGRELFYWRIFQRFDFDDPFSYFRNPLQNKVGFSPIEGLELSSILSYSFFYNNLQELSVSASYVKKYLNTSLTYYIKNQFNDITTLKQETTANYLSFNFSNDFGYFGLNASIGLNFNNLAHTRKFSDALTNWSFGIFKNIRCFGIGLRLASQRMPILTNDTTSGGYAASVLNNTYVKFEFSFSPLTQTGLTYRFYNK
nr:MULTISPECIES: LPS assembly protein LptD [unclassified Helicobacter]